MGGLDFRRESAILAGPVAKTKHSRMENPIPADQPVQRLKAKDIIEGGVLPLTKVQFFGRAGTRELENLDSGIFFIFAWWSGPSHIALDRLAKAILKADPGGV